MLQMLDCAGHFNQKLLRHFASEAVPNQDALNDKIFAIGRHGIRRNQPAALAQPIRHVIKRERRGCGVSPLPAKARDAADSVIDDLERAEFSNLTREILSDCRALRLNFAITLLAEAQKIVVLADNFSSGPRKVERKGRHISAEIVDVEDQLFRQIVLLAP